MTNQASEDDLNNMLIEVRHGRMSNTKALAIIRTEKLKLLTVVRERVVGKNSNTHWSACNNHGKGKPNYKCVCGLEAANDSRTAQMAALTKLEAEL